LKKNHLFIKGLIVTIIILIINVNIVPSIYGIYGYVKQQDLTNDIIKQTYNCKYSDESSNLDKINLYTIHVESVSKPLFWWDNWDELPGHYEPFFNVEDIIEYDEQAYGVTTADFNNDKILDFAVSYTDELNDPYISIFYNNGDKTFNEEKIIKIEDLGIVYPSGAWTPACDDLDSSDFDNDGDIDLLMTYNERKWRGGLLYNWNGTGVILFNDGSCNFNQWKQVFWHPRGEEYWDKYINPHVTSNDFDNDGDIDFLVGDNSGIVKFYKNDGNANFIRVCNISFGGIISWGLTSGDFDNDGDIDFLMTEEITPGESNENFTFYAHVFLVYNDGTDECFNHDDWIRVADMPPEESFFVSLGPNDEACLCTIDYNNDGLLDFLFGGVSCVLMFIQQNDGSFTPFSVARLPAPAYEDGGWSPDDLQQGGIAVGDFDGDSLQDAVVGGVQGVVRIFYNNYTLVDIVFPDRYCIIKNNEIKFWDFFPIYNFFKYSIAFVFRDVDVIAVPLQPLSKVEFYLDDKLVFTDDSEPYKWSWDSFSFGKHKVKALGFDLDNNEVGFDDSIIWKFL
jgi:hypothetical protein